MSDESKVITEAIQKSNSQSELRRWRDAIDGRLAKLNVLPATGGKYVPVEELAPAVAAEEAENQKRANKG